jgi:hypothetical protein
VSRPLTLLVLVCAVAGCRSGRTVAVQVSVSGPDSVESPVPGVVLTAVPFDRDSLLAALEARAATPRPHVAELDSAFAAYRRPFLALAEASRTAAALRDSTAARSDDAGLAARRASADAKLAAARRALDSVRDAGAPRIDSLRRAVSQWENSTYRDYDSIATAWLRRTGRDVTGDTTGADGWTRVRVPAGRWWVYGTSWDVTDPNRYWYWNLPLTGDTLRLTSRTGVRRPRY